MPGNLVLTACDTFSLPLFNRTNLQKILQFFDWLPGLKTLSQVAQSKKVLPRTQCLWTEPNWNGIHVISLEFENRHFHSLTVTHIHQSAITLKSPT